MSECLFCMSELSDVVYYLIAEDKWQEHTSCFDCIQYIIQNNWKLYLKNIKNADCEKSLKEILNNGLINYLTLNGNIFGTIVKKIKYNDKIYETRLTNSLSDELLNEINLELKQILNNMEIIIDYDYINQINNLLKKYNL